MIWCSIFSTNQKTKLMQNIWATFARNFVPKNFQKSPKLVILWTISQFPIRLFYFIPLSTKSSDLNHRDISIDTWIERSLWLDRFIRSFSGNWKLCRLQWQKKVILCYPRIIVWERQSSHLLTWLTPLWKTKWSHVVVLS